MGYLPDLTPLKWPLCIGLGAMVGACIVPFWFLLAWLVNPALWPYAAAPVALGALIGGIGAAFVK